MIRCIAVDDETPALDILEDNISRVPFLQFGKKMQERLPGKGHAAAGEDRPGVPGHRNAGSQWITPAAGAGRQTHGHFYYGLPEICGQTDMTWTYWTTW